MADCGDCGLCGDFSATTAGGGGESRSGTLTCVEVPVGERLQDAVHGPHVEQEAELRDAHGHQAEQEGRGGDGLQEGLGCGGNEAGLKALHMGRAPSSLIDGPGSYTQRWSCSPSPGPWWRGRACSRPWRTGRSA